MTTSHDLAPGQIRFVHHAHPPLASGTYAVDVSQHVKRPGPREDVDQTFERSQVLHVRGPRFGLQPSDVHAVYPPASSTGSYDRTLPHVVLRRRTLPWEVDLGGTDRDPWLALLVFHAGEVPAVTTGSRSELLAAHTPSVTLPDLNVDPDVDGDPQVRVVDVSPEVLARVLPRRPELRWLAHARQVRTDGKELLGLADDGWFSVVIADRLPGPGTSTAHLVSLEGWDAQLDGGLLGDDPLRMVSLASWSFTSTGRASLAEKLRGVDSGPLVAHRPPPGAEEQVDDGGVTAAAVAAGFVPLRYDMRQGEQSVAWYRGPLTPLAVPPAEDRGPFATAEAGLVYHPDIAMFDVSLAVAWQIGRLLALSDATFCQALMTWRRLAQARVDRLVAQDEARQRHADLEAFEVVGRLAAEVADWQAEHAGGSEPTDEELLQLSARLRALVTDLDDPALRSLVLEARDPDRVATSTARYARESLLDPLLAADVLPRVPDPKPRLGSPRPSAGGAR